MPVNFNDLRDYTARKNADNPDKRVHLQAVQEVGRRAQMVIDHPGWQTFVDHIEELRRVSSQTREGLVKQMTDGDVLGQELEKLKLRVKALDGEIKGLTQAIDLIPEMIKRAQQAADELLNLKYVPPTEKGAGSANP